jgi:DNA-binding cell septation regulator SpoVG
MTAAIEVLAIRRSAGTTSVKAFVDIRIGAVEINGCKIVQQEGQCAWLAMPSIKTERAWQNAVEITGRDLKQRITDVVLEAWERSRCEVIPPRPVRGQSTWDRTRDIPTGRMIEHRNERADPRQEHIGELARRFDERGHEEPPF